MRGETVRYNTKQRYGKGFTFAELEKSGLTPRYATSIGISVDWRRQNTNSETLQANVDRLKSY